MAPDLDFKVHGAEVRSHCVVPTLSLDLGIQNLSAERVRSLSLQCQVRIEAQRRRYGEPEKQRLLDLFGLPDRWSQTLKSLLWTSIESNVRGFDETTRTELLLPCTYDFNVLAARYMHALEGGSVPLLFLFSGSIFFTDEEGLLQVSMVSWSKEAEFELPVDLWKSMMEVYYPNAAWLCLQKHAFDSLAAYKSARGLATWEQTLETLLRAAEEPATN